MSNFKKMCGCTGKEIKGHPHREQQPICQHLGIGYQEEATHLLFPDGRKIYIDDSRFEQAMNDTFTYASLPTLCEQHMVYYICRHGYRLGNDGLGLAIVRFDPNTKDEVNWDCEKFSPTPRWEKVYNTTDSGILVL